LVLQVKEYFKTKTTKLFEVIKFEKEIWSTKQT